LVSNHRPLLVNKDLGVVSVVKPTIVHSRPLTNSGTGKYG
jgi:hypothetical protein